MVNFELRQLEYFLAVVEEMNISQAAKKLGITQPALSRQIRAFEESPGWTLFERGKKSISPTRQGAIVVKEGKNMMSSFEISVKRMKQEIDGAELRVGYAPSLLAIRLKIRRTKEKRELTSVWSILDPHEDCAEAFLEADPAESFIEVPAAQPVVLPGDLAIDP